MDAPTHRHRCTLLGLDGHVCGRTLGPYYSPAYLRDAVRAHRVAQHATTLDKMQDREPGDSRIKSALSKNAPYEPPSIR